MGTFEYEVITEVCVENHLPIYEAGNSLPKGYGELKISGKLQEIK